MELINPNESTVISPDFPNSLYCFRPNTYLLQLLVMTLKNISEQNISELYIKKQRLSIHYQHETEKLKQNTTTFDSDGTYFS